MIKFLILFLSAWSADTDVNITGLSDAFHIEFSGQKNWDYQVEKNEKELLTTVAISVPRLSVAANDYIKNVKIAGIKNIEITHQGPDNKDILTVQIENKKDLEVFDYLTDQPSRLIIDIYQEKKSTPVVRAPVDPVTPVKKVKEKKERVPASSDVISVNVSGKLEMEAKNDQGIFDGVDPDFKRFSISEFEIKEESVILSSENVYLEYPMLPIAANRLPELVAKQPIYEVLPKDSEENKHARLLLTLFKNKRHRVFNKTVDWFFNKYAQSEYDELIRFMWADTNFALWQETDSIESFELAMTRYRQAVEKYPDSPLAERSRLIMGFATMKRGDHLGALRKFQDHLMAAPHSPNKDLIKLASAESLLNLHRYDEAAAAYKEIEEQAILEDKKIQAAFSIGDVYYKQKNFSEATKQYELAHKKYPAHSDQFPNAYYNLAAAYFGDKKYLQSLNYNIEFLKKFSSSDFAGYAMTRVGETLDILGAPESKVMGAYMEATFRYGETPGALVARLRILGKKMQNMKNKEVERAVSEINELAKKSNLNKVEQFAAIIIGDGYATRNEFDKGINLLLSYYQSHPTTADKNLLTNRIVKFINEKFTHQTNQGDFISALSTYNKYADTWLKGSDRIDTQYNLGRCYQQAGVWGQAQVFFKETLDKVVQLSGTQAEKERNIFEKLPSQDEILLRLAQTAYGEKKHTQSYEYLRRLKNPQKLSEDQQIERVALAADLLEKEGQLDSAARYWNDLISQWSGAKELLANPYLYLAKVNLKRQKPDLALSSLEKVHQLMSDTQKVAVKDHVESLKMTGEIFLSQGKVEDGIKQFELLLELYGKQQSLDPVRYKLGQLYFKKGNMKKASEVWETLAVSKDNTWYRLAKEELNQSQWTDEYKKYIKRIPAMSEGVQ